MMLFHLAIILCNQVIHGPLQGHFRNKQFQFTIWPHEKLLLVDQHKTKYIEGAGQQDVECRLGTDQHIQSNFVPVMQPIMKKQRYLTQVTDIKYFSNPSISKYKLILLRDKIELQNRKHNLQKTVTHGAQRIFNGAEAPQEQFQLQLHLDS